MLAARVKSERAAADRAADKAALLDEEKVLEENVGESTFSFVSKFFQQ